MKWLGVLLGLPCPPRMVIFAVRARQGDKGFAEACLQPRLEAGEMPTALAGPQVLCRA